MYIPTQLIVTNFQSFESLHYRFSQGKPIIVIGENLTDEGQESNGSGKSSFGEILYYIFLGSSSTGKRDIKLVKWGEKQATLSLELENKYLNHILRIERVLYSNGNSSKLKIFINDIEQNDKYSSVATANKYLLSLIDISAEDLKNYFLINSEKFVSFFTSSDTVKRDLIGRFSSASRINKIEDIVKQELVQPERNIQNLQQKITESKVRIEVLNERIEETKQLYSKEKIKEQCEVKEYEAESYKDRIKELETLTAASQVEINLASKVFDSLQNRLSTYERATKKLLNFDYDLHIQNIEKGISSVQEKISKENKNITKSNREIQSLNEEVQPLSIALAGRVTCPSCHYVFIPSSNIDIEEAKILIKEVNHEVTSLQKVIQENEKLIKKIEDNELKNLQVQLLNLQKQKKKCFNLSTRIRQKTETTLDNINQVSQKLSTLSSRKKRSEDEVLQQESYLEKTIQEINEIKKQKFDKKVILTFELKIEELEKQIQDYEIDITEFEQQIQSLKMWSLNLQNFYIYLTNKSLSNIEGYCNLFLQKIKTNLQVKFEGFKTLADGSIREQINVHIYRDGIDEEDYRCFSGGEKGRLILSTILTFQQLINQKSNSGGLDLLWVDEVLDKVDPLGMKLFIDSLQEVGKTLFLVSQVKTKEIDNNTLIIIKENGVSKI